MDHVKSGRKGTFSPKHRNTVSLDSSCSSGCSFSDSIESSPPLPCRVPTSETTDSNLILSSEDHNQSHSPTQLQRAVNADDFKLALPSTGPVNSPFAIFTLTSYLCLKTNIPNLASLILICCSSPRMLHFTKGNCFLTHGFQ